MPHIVTPHFFSLFLHKFLTQNSTWFFPKMEGRGVFIGGIEKWEASIGVPSTPMPAPFLSAMSYPSSAFFFFFVFFWFLAWYFHSYLEAFPKIFFFGFYMHGKLWISSFQWSWLWLIWSYDNWDITLEREVTQNREILSVFSWKNHIFQFGVDIFEPFWWNLAKTLFFKMVQLVHSSSCPIETVYCAKSGKNY